MLLLASAVSLQKDPQYKGWIGDTRRSDSLPVNLTIDST
jgi:hypothetical protein